MATRSWTQRVKHIETKSYAAYGEITYAFEGGLSLTGGIRYTKDEKTG